MKKLNQYYQIIHKFIYKRIEVFMVFAAFMSFIPGIVSFIAISFFIWNFFNKKAFLFQSFIFFTIAIVINIYVIAFIKPVIEKFHKRKNQIGYDEFNLTPSQQKINMLARFIEDYKIDFGEYPINLNQLPHGSILNYDLSYKNISKNGEVIGSNFYYKKLEKDKFFLAGVGEDGIIETDDDLIPQIFEDEETKTGLIRYKLKSRPKKELFIFEEIDGVKY